MHVSARMIKTQPTRIALIGDYALFQLGLAEILHKEAGLKVVASVSTKADMGVLYGTQPDLILLHCDLLGTGTVGVMCDLTSQLPNVRVIIMSTPDDADLVRQVVEAGARGFVLKAASHDELLTMVRTISNEPDRVVLSVSIKTMRHLNRTSEQLLSPRELQVLGLLAQGMRNAGIAQSLFIAESTVKRHLTNIYGKLDARTRVEALKKAVALGIVPFPDSPTAAISHEPTTAN